MKKRTLRFSLRNGMDRPVEPLAHEPAVEHDSGDIVRDEMQRALVELGASLTPPPSHHDEPEPAPKTASNHDPAPRRKPLRFNIPFDRR